MRTGLALSGRHQGRGQQLFSPVPPSNNYLPGGCLALGIRDFLPPQSVNSSGACGWSEGVCAMAPQWLFTCLWQRDREWPAPRLLGTGFNLFYGLVFLILF